MSKTDFRFSWPMFIVIKYTRLLDCGLMSTVWFPEVSAMEAIFIDMLDKVSYKEQ